jgi:hypothetical protein
MALAAVLRCKPGKSYAASVWVRANRPGTLVEVNLLEVVGGWQAVCHRHGGGGAGKR